MARMFASIDVPFSHCRVASPLVAARARGGKSFLVYSQTPSARITTRTSYAATTCCTLRGCVTMEAPPDTRRGSEEHSQMSATPFHPPLRIVGREEEIATLLAATRGCLAGQPQLMLITGEPGVGKTRLLGEVVGLAAAELGAQLLSGYALEGGGALPYFPLGRALRGNVARLVQEHPGLWAAASVLAAAGLSAADFPGYRPPVTLGPEAERLRLFDAFADVCLQLAAQRPLLLALDDLQWADAGTWDMLAYGVRAAAGGRFGVIVACREEVLASGGVAHHALVELNRHRLLLHLPLGRLSPQAVRLLGQEFLGGALTDDLAATLARRSEGNPFFAEEVLRGLQRQIVQDWSGAYYIPARERAAAEVTTSATLRLTIVRRLEALPPETLQLLLAAAVLGRTSAVRTLARMAGLGPDTVERQLRPAVVASVVTLAVGEVTFVHDLLRETAYELAAGEQHRLHAAAAAALEEDGDRTLQHWAALAYHWQLADVPLRAAQAASAAAHAARQVAAFSEELHYAGLACALYGQALGSGATADDLQRAQLALAEAALTCGNYGEAEAAFRQALAGAERRGEQREQGRLWARLGVLYHRQERPEESAACLHRALTLLEPLAGTAAEQLAVLIELASLEGLTRARYPEATTLGERARALATELGDLRGQADAALALAGVQLRAVDPTAGRPLLREALDLALAVGDPLLASEVCGSLSNSYYWSGELQQARTDARRRLELAEQAGDVFGMRHAHSWLANVLLTLGEFDAAQQLLDHCEPLLARLDNPEPIAVVRIFSAVIALHRGAFARATALLDEALAVLLRVDPATVVWYRGLSVLTCLALGHRAEAQEHLRAVEATLATMPESALPARSARTVIGLAYAELESHAAAAACEQALRPYAADHHWWLTRRTLATLAALRGDTAQALTDLAAAEALARRERLLPDLGRLLLLRGQVLGGGHATGQAALREARDLFRHLGMQADLAHAERLATAAALPADLTRRELEVLRHLAQGRTNREIAELLHISEHTVVNHLSHIYGKINVDNRTAAAAYALREGLA
ncbi:MAG: hypothetical protein DCC58_02475 [Chloroflexi bacterium]|nr:MAG: hypothetical protein DCC58_02475 [Chloroflexota bacterium]